MCKTDYTSFRIPYSIILFLACFPMWLAAQKEFKLSGYVTDNREKLVSTHIYIHELQRGTYTDSTGFYTLTLTQGTYNLLCSHVGYKTVTKKVLLNRSQRIDFKLVKDTSLQQEVVIRIDKEEEIFHSSQGATHLSAQEIKQLPTLLGEPDPVKLLQHTASVTTNGDGKTGLFVRGGNADHTRVLYNRNTIYNPYHLLGIFSVFNPDAVHDISLYTSGISPEYSGLIGSFLDVRSSETLPKRFSLNGSVGILSSRMHLSVPVSSKCAFDLSARLSHITHIIKPLLQKTGISNDMLGNSSYDFYDYNASFLWQPSEKDKITFHAYAGDDFAKMPFNVYDIHFKMAWQNQAASLHWQHLFHNDLFLEQTLNWSRYHSNTQFSQSTYRGRLKTLLNEYTYKATINYLKHNHWLKAGYELIFNRTIPNNARLTLNNEPIEQEQPLRFYNTQLGLFANEEWEWNKWLLDIGMRYTLYHGGTQRQKEVIIPIECHNATYHAWEPRLSLRYALTENQNLKAAYAHHIQFMHLIPLSSSTGLPMDYWIPSTSQIKPQNGDQWSIGYFGQTADNNWNWGAEVYYKRMHQQLESKNNLISIFEQNNAIQHLEKGKGWAYGLEISLKKKMGQWTGWSSYTLSKNMRQFKNINDRDPFPAYSDRRHDFSLVLQYTPHNRWRFSSAFVYSTGKPLSVPTGLTIINGTIINEYSRFNTQRMPAYHRMDLSATRTFRHSDKFYSELNISFYNIYWRKNAFIVIFTANENKENHSYHPGYRQGSLFPVIPSVSWNFYF